MKTTKIGMIAALAASLVMASATAGAGIYNGGGITSASRAIYNGGGVTAKSRAIYNGGGATTKTRGIYNGGGISAAAGFTWSK